MLLDTRPTYSVDVGVKIVIVIVHEQGVRW